MPLTNREALQLGILILCVPLQYFLSYHFSTTVSERTESFLKVTTVMKKIKSSLHIDAKAAIQQILAWWEKGLPGRPTEPGPSPGESPAVEVMQYREREFGGPPRAVRSVRPGYLRYRVGQVVRHKQLGFRAVIVGWDLRPAPPDSYTAFPGVIFDAQNQVVQTTPHYLLLVDQRDQLSNMKTLAAKFPTYVIQTQLDLVKNTELQNPDIKKYFLYFDGSQYIPKDSLRKLYPRD